MKLSWNSDDGYMLTLSQDELDFISTSISLSRTHVSDSEYEIVIGRPKDIADEAYSDLVAQEHEVYQRRVYAELESKGAIAAVIRALGDLSALPEDQIVARILAESSERGRAIEDANRQVAILSQKKITSLVGELSDRGSDVAGIMRSMLEAEDPGVQLTAAEQLLPIDPPAGIRVLESLAVKRYARIAYTAELILRNRRIGPQ